MKLELEDLSEEAYNFLWPEDDYMDSEDESFDDWLFSLANQFGGF